MKNVAALQAYNARELPCKIKLDANESPFGFPAALKKISSVDTNRYPDPEARELRKLVAKRYGVNSANLLHGNGSDELISCLIMTYGGPVLYPVPSFSMYGIIAQAHAQKISTVPLDGNFDLDMDALLPAIRKQKPKLTFLSSPNNPTGNCFSADRILKTIESSPGIVVVDEAYQPFSSRKGMIPFLKDYKNLVILRTLSKIGLASLRLGFMVADSEITEEVNKVRLPFNVNSLSQSVASAALKNKKTLNASLNSIISERRRLLDAMKKINGIHPFPSEANFILFRTEDPVRLYKFMLKKGILIRNVHESVKGCLRVTIGTPRENTAFLKVLHEALKVRG